MDLIMYTRVSSRGQLDSYGLDVQRADCRAWAKAHGHKIIREESDEARRGTRGVDVVEGIGANGEHLAERPGLRDAVAAVQDGEAGGIITGRLDRLGRATHVQEGILALVWRAGGHVFAADAGEIVADDASDPMRVAVRKMMAVFGELERALAVERMRKGREAKAAAGRHAVGPYRFGTKGGGSGRDRDAVPNEHEAAAVARIGQLRAAGLSYRAIISQLETEGIRPRNAERWSPSTVRKIAMRLDA